MANRSPTVEKKNQNKTWPSLIVTQSVCSRRPIQKSYLDSAVWFKWYQVASVDRFSLLGSLMCYNSIGQRPRSTFSSPGRIMLHPEFWVVVHSAPSLPHFDREHGTMRKDYTLRDKMNVLDDNIQSLTPLTFWFKFFKWACLVLFLFASKLLQISCVFPILSVADNKHATLGTNQI